MCICCVKLFWPIALKACFCSTALLLAICWCIMKLMFLLSLLACRIPALLSMVCLSMNVVQLSETLGVWYFFQLPIIVHSPRSYMLSTFSLHSLYILSAATPVPDSVHRCRQCRVSRILLGRQCCYRREGHKIWNWDHFGEAPRSPPGLHRPSCHHQGDSRTGRYGTKCSCNGSRHDYWNL